MATAIERARSTVKSTSGTNLAAGIWLILAPFILGYAAVTAGVWNDVLIGLAIATLAWIRVAKPQQRDGASRTNVVFGVWLLAAPFAVGYAGTAEALWNDIVIGLGVLVLGTWSAIASRNHQPTGREQAMTG